MTVTGASEASLGCTLLNEGLQAGRLRHITLRVQGIVAVVLGGLAAFVVGSVPFGFIVGKLRGVDIRTQGSGNIGATNAGRVLGRKWGILVFLFDVGKGVLAVWLGTLIAGHAAEWVGPVMGVAGVLGHNYCPWLGFKGGKGIATSASALAMICPFSFGWAVGAWVLVFLLSRYVSLASIAAAVVLAVSGVWHYGLGPIGIMAVVLGVVATLRHRSNITRLLNGTEPKSGGRKTEKAA